MAKRLAPNLRALLRLALPLALAALPFELAAGLALGPLTLTNVELLILLALGLWAALLLAEGRRPAGPAWLTVGAAGLVAALALSAALAAEERAGALKFALRQGFGAALALCLADMLRREGRALAAGSAGALLLGAGLSAALGLWEMGESPAALAALAVFKSEASYMGGLLRLSGTLSYANTAAMYYEALLPLALLLAAGSWRLAPGRLWAAAAFGLAAALLLLATLLTYSRAALATTALLLALAPALAWLALGPRPARPVAAGAGALAALGLGLALVEPTVGLRLSEPDVARWYGASYRPGPVPTLAPNQLVAVPVELRNSGRVAWEPGGPRPVRLSYHWLDAASGRVVRYEGRRTELPGPVAPGETVTVSATVQAPLQPGRYLLAWDMLREYIGRGWFSQMGIEPARVLVEVRGEAAAAAPPQASGDPPSAPREIVAQPGPPGRGVLWRAALALWAERPLLGIGPDVFRHIYGPRLGLAAWDDRVHTNSLYLELLTGSGLLGLAAFLALLGAALWAGWRALGQGGEERSGLGAGSAERVGPAALSDARILLGALLGLLAFLVHGALDVFLAFTPTYALLWALLGLAGGLAGPALRRR